jgi:hypothetical protein
LLFIILTLRLSCPPRDVTFFVIIKPKNSVNKYLPIEGASRNTSNYTRPSNGLATLDWLLTAEFEGTLTLVASDDRGIGSGGRMLVTASLDTASNFVCAFPMSSNYSLLQRLLFYALFITGLLTLKLGFIGMFPLA